MEGKLIVDDSVNVSENQSENELETVSESACVRFSIDNDLREGIGKETLKWNSCLDYENFEGQFLHDSLHGAGKYTWCVNGKKTNYKGLFYCSKLEGYGKLSHSDSTTFEGLFKNNRRFGPGVLTYANGSQDVGLWYGNNLYRLCKIVSPEWVPRISRTPVGKLKLLRYKKLVKICTSVCDQAATVLNDINANEEVMAQSHKLYNVFIRNPKSLFLNAALYDDNYFTTKDCYIEIATSPHGDPADETVQEHHIQDMLLELDNAKKDLIEELQKSESKKIRRSRILKTKSVGFANIDESTEQNDVNISRASQELVAAEEAVHLLKTKIKDLETKITEAQYKKENTLTQRVLVTDLLAWNNQETSIEMMKCAFEHRKFEKNMSYCVSDVLSGVRTKFRDCGKYESDCVDFLRYCSFGNFKKLSEFLIKYDLNPDMCDAKGNSGIIYASARDRCKTIKTLVTFGANVDVFNDECFTPLTMCLTRYLAVLNNVTNWEAAFLKPSQNTMAEDEVEVQQWRPHVSLVSLYNIQKELSTSSDLFDPYAGMGSRYKVDMYELESDPDFLDSNNYLKINYVFKPFTDFQDLQEDYVPKSTQQLQEYLFRTDCVHLSDEKKVKQHKKSKAKKAKKETKAKTKTSEKTDDIQFDKRESADGILNDKLNAINVTILTLLESGADPDLGEVPMPVLLLAIFTQNLKLIEDILRKNANPNSKSLEDELTGIHILVSLPPNEKLNKILELLLVYSADSNQRASVNHWPEEKALLLGKHNLINSDSGKTPLHLLAMRYDFPSDSEGHLLQLASTLVKNGASAGAQYLGHSPLSLAVLRANAKLAQTLLSSGKVNPNEQLGEEMGVALTVLILKRYTSLPDLPACQEILQLLIDYGANPFASTGKRGNVIEFMDKEFASKKTDEKVKGKKGKKDKKRIQVKGKKIQKTKKEKASLQEQVKSFLERLAENLLVKYLKCWIVKHLFNFVEQQDYYDDLSENIAKFVSVSEVIDIAQQLFHRGEIVDTADNCVTLHDLLEFVVNVQYKSKDGIKPDISTVIKNFDYKKLSNQPAYSHLPVEKNIASKYIVCFNCLKKLDCELFKCPKCQLIYFCSEKCNKVFNSRRKSAHPCQNSFYNDEKEIWLERIARSQENLKGTMLNLYKATPQSARFVVPDPERRLHKTRSISSRKSTHAVGPPLDEKKDLQDTTRKSSEITGQGLPKKRVESNQKRGKEAPTAEEKRLTDLKELCSQKRRLPTKYQYFLEKIAEYWPEFDLSMLFLPYACYKEGQLYYRFSGHHPVFAETYSIA